MRRLKGIIAALVLAVAGLRAETLTVATYNVENYTAANRMSEAGYREDYPKPEAEKAALREVIRGLNADVLVLQEMGPQPYLDELQRDLKQAGLDYPHAVLLDGPDADRHVALLSRRELKAVQPHPALEFTYFGAKEKVKRGLLEARIATAAGEVTIFGLHLKSRYTDRPDDPLSAQRRLEEALAIRDEILRRFPEPGQGGVKFLILGDFNDARTSKPLQRLRERGKTIVAEVLPAEDSRGETWTHHYRKEDSYSRVDHILVSAGLRPSVRGGRATIYDGPGSNEASDHRPVVVTLEFGKKARSE